MVGEAHSCRSSGGASGEVGNLVALMECYALCHRTFVKRWGADATSQRKHGVIVLKSSAHRRLSHGQDPERANANMGEPRIVGRKQVLGIKVDPCVTTMGQADTY